jgi:hypothetical protein
MKLFMADSLIAESWDTCASDDWDSAMAEAQAEGLRYVAPGELVSLVGRWKPDADWVLDIMDEFCAEEICPWHEDSMFHATGEDKADLERRLSAAFDAWLLAHPHVVATTYVVDTEQARSTGEETR